MGIINSFGSRKILVIGEAIIDEYQYGSSKRLAPEIPLPVVIVEKQVVNLGGAGNLARNLTNLGAKVDLLTAAKKGRLAKRYSKLAAKEGIKLYLAESEFSVVRKQRTVVNNLQITRLEFRSSAHYELAATEKLLITLEELRKNKYDAIILSDYNYGIFTKKLVDYVFAMFPNAVKLCDARPDNMDIFKSSDILKCNFEEISTYLIKKYDFPIENTDKSLESAAKFLKDFKSVLITRGPKGMTYFQGEKVIQSPTTPRSVRDPSGAGDTTSAVFLLTYIYTKDPIYSMQLANAAADIAISKLGCFPITLNEFRRTLPIPENKILNSIEEITALISELRANNKKIVYTNGCFDLLHAGHTHYLKAAKEFGDILIVGVNSDESVRNIKSKERPLNPQDLRLQLLSSLSYIDYVVLFNESDSTNLLKLIKPDIYVKGEDYSNKDIPEFRLSKQLSILIKFVPLLRINRKKLSTSDLLKKE